MRKDQKNKYTKLYVFLNKVIHKAKEMEEAHRSDLKKVHPIYRKSAENMIHYLAFRSFNIARAQELLRELGLPSLSTIESHVMSSLLALQEILQRLLNIDKKISTKGYITAKKSEKILRKNNKLLFGYKSKTRSTRIMVTLPNTAAEDPKLVHRLISLGMNCARINCAHDDEATWKKMVTNVREASKKLNKKCKIAMDLAGPKLRTGAMTPGPKVIHIKPSRDDLGNVVQPALIWISLPDIPPPAHSDPQAILPVSEDLYKKIKRGNTIYFTDSRGKKGKIRIERKEGKGKWGLCSDSAYLETGTELVLHKFKQTGEEVNRVGELLPKEQFLRLSPGDTLILHKAVQRGENASHNGNGQVITHAHISCTLPEVFVDVKPGEAIFFDDGKIEGKIEKVNQEEIKVNIEHTKDGGSKLKADKGINLPESQLRVSGLTAKDIRDLDFVAGHADAINFSFVNKPEDVKDLHNLLKEKKSTAGIILKIETQSAFANLPSILLRAMRQYPVGVMIARGDLAVETGWNNFATIQDEIMRICSSAHIPDIWATQVLETLAKKGTPSRAEITDAALAERATCVMLNKGFYIHRAVKMLDKILRRMQSFQNKNAVVLPKLEKADQLELSHKSFDV